MSNGVRNPLWRVVLRAGGGFQKEGRGCRYTGAARRTGSGQGGRGGCRAWWRLPWTPPASCPDLGRPPAWHFRLGVQARTLLPVQASGTWGDGQNGPMVTRDSLGPHGHGQLQGPRLHLVPWRTTVSPAAAREEDSGCGWQGRMTQSSGAGAGVRGVKLQGPHRRGCTVGKYSHIISSAPDPPNDFTSSRVAGRSVRSAGLCRRLQGARGRWPRRGAVWRVFFVTVADVDGDDENEDDNEREREKWGAERAGSPPWKDYGEAAALSGWARGAAGTQPLGLPLGLCRPSHPEAHVHPTAPSQGHQSAPRQLWAARLPASTWDENKLLTPAPLPGRDRQTLWDAVFRGDTRQGWSATGAPALGPLYPELLASGLEPPPLDDSSTPAGPSLAPTALPPTGRLRAGAGC